MTKPETGILSKYACPECGHAWESEWSSPTDEDCEKCGSRDITPVSSAETDDK